MPTNINQSNVNQPKPFKKAIYTAQKALEEAPEITGVPTGIEGLDNLFYKKANQPLNGIPRYSVFNITGVSDTGKSLMAEQMAVKWASLSFKVMFVTVESPANFVISGIKQRAEAMGIDFNKIEQNIILIDVASYSYLQENLPDLLATFAYTIKEYDVSFTIIDSVTGLYEHKEILARTVVRKLFNFMKKWYQTAIFISQKRSGHETLTAEAAGGYAVGHIVDGTMVLSKEIVDTPYKAKLYHKPIGEIVRLFRIDGCRLTGHDTKTHYLEITKEGLVKIGGPLGSE